MVSLMDMETLPTGLEDAARACREYLAALRFARFRFELEWTTEALLPPYKGSMLRGALMAQFKRFVCPFAQSQCDACLLATSCQYIQLFERESPQTGEATRDSLPFILEVPREKYRLYEAGGTLSFGITLLESAVGALPHLIYAVQRMGQSGVGSGRKRGMGRFVLKRVSQGPGEDGRSVYSSEAPKLQPMGPLESGQSLALEEERSHVDLRVAFKSPLRAQSDGAFLKTLDFSTLIRLVMRRLRLLGADYLAGPTPAEFRQLVQFARKQPACTGAQELHWYDWTRFSNRQKKTMKLGGLVGECIFLQVPTPYLWFLRLGEALHLGKNASFGLGRYQLEIPASPSASGPATAQMEAKKGEEYAL